jgi:hypothetical protein
MFWAITEPLVPLADNIRLRDRSISTDSSVFPDTLTDLFLDVSMLVVGY